MTGEAPGNQVASAGGGLGVVMRCEDVVGACEMSMQSARIARIVSRT
jgi:hypothetical protein